MQLNRIEKFKPKDFSKKGNYNKIFKFLGILELLAIFLFWIFIFKNHELFGGYTRNEIITYLLLGNFFGLLSGIVLKKVISSEIVKTQKDLFANKPIKFIYKIFINNAAKAFTPFLSALFFQFLLMYLFFDSIIINLDMEDLLVISVIIFLSFLTELIMFNLFHLTFFWSYESKDLVNFLRRIKMIFAGGYFPLSMLPNLLLKVGLYLPFSYSFYVPTQVYLNKMTIKEAQTGIFIQIVWIIIFYFIFKYIYKRKKLEMI